MLDVFAQVMVPILLVVGAGYALGRATPIDLRPVTKISLYLLSPALIFSSLVKTDVSGLQTFRVVVFMLLLVGAMALLTVGAGRLLNFSRQTNTAMVLCTMFSNTGNYGLPLAQFAFGHRGFEYALPFFIMQGVLAQTLGIYLAGSGKTNWRDGVSSLVRMPQLYSVSAALVLRAVGPEFVTESHNVLNDLFRGVTLMGQGAIPLLLVVLGIQLAKAKIEPSDNLQIGVATAIKLLLAVPVSYALARALGLDPLSTKLAVILGSMPTAVNVTVLSVQFDLRPALTSSIVVVSTALSFVTLTVLIEALGGG